MSNKWNNYEVGYGKPPTSTRFKPGQSGNPKGRGKGPKNKDILSSLLDEMFGKISITENGKKSKITKVEALFKKLMAEALNGDAKSLNALIKLLPFVQRHSEVATLEPPIINIQFTDDIDKNEA